MFFNFCKLVNKTLTDDAGIFYMRPLMYKANGELIFHMTRNNFELNYTVYENKFKCATEGVPNVEQAVSQGLTCVCCIIYNGRYHAVILDSIIDGANEPCFKFKNSYINDPSITMAMTADDAPHVFYFVNIIYKTAMLM